MKIIPAAALAILLWLVPLGAIAAEPMWIGSWASSQQIPEPANALPPAGPEDATLRQIVHLSLGGQTLRVRLSNAFGTEPLHITSVHIAKPMSPASPALRPGTDAMVTFAGAPDITIPAGADYISDPVAFDAPPGSDPGAPAAPNLGRKALWTTLVAAVVFAALDAYVYFVGW